MEAIKAVLKTFDIAGAITLVSPTHAEYFYEISPSWSCAHFENDEDGYAMLRFRSKKEEHGSKEAQLKSQDATVHMIVQLKDIAAQTFGAFDPFAEMLENRLHVTDSRPPATPHEQI